MPNAPNPQRTARVRAAWAEDASLPPLRICLEHQGLCQLRARRRTPTGSFVLAVQLLSAGGMMLELTAQGDCIGDVVAALGRIEAAEGGGTE